MATKRIVRHKCPYCTKMFEREPLVRHVDDDHQDMIPEGYSALRVVFDYVNKKPPGYNGKCTECGKETGWDENKGRYNRQCGSKACHDSFVRKFEENMKRTRGVDRISKTADGQAKMLANRKISGTYKFQNGKEKTYTGSYELKALQFMDTVMNIDPDDLLCPGPVLEYTYQGSFHMYITDFYYIPYNLVIEVKDGGNHPNKRDMPDYRGKQIAKEEFIIKNTDYNYLRLVDNDFSQLLAVFMDLKLQLVENSGERVIHVNEAIEKIAIERSYELLREKLETKEYEVINISNDKNAIDEYLSKRKKQDYIDSVKKYYTGEVIIDKNTKELIGHVLVGDKKDKGFITDLVVEKKYRGQGFGSLLVKDAISEFHGVDLTVKKDNKIAIDLYKKNGFVIVESSDSKYYYMKLKSKLKSGDKVINEAMNALMTGYIPGFNSPGSVCVVNYMQNNVFSGENLNDIAFADNIKLDNLIARDKEGVLRKAPEDFLKNCNYEVYMISDPKVRERLNELTLDEFCSTNDIYEAIFEHKMYCFDQIKTEKIAKRVFSFEESMNMIKEATVNYILGKPKMIIQESGKFFDVMSGKFYVESSNGLFLDSTEEKSQGTFLEILSSRMEET